MNFDTYWDCLDEKFVELIQNGYVKLPSIKDLDLEETNRLISSQISDRIYSEIVPQHKVFLDQIKLDKYLAPKLFDIARKEFGYKGTINNQYHIARCPSPGDKKYRAHFDSHLFTLVIPIKIPEPQSIDSSIGELIFFPGMRASPKNPLNDFIGKVWFKQYSSETGIKRLSKRHKINVNSFTDYEPLLFLGNTVFHSNKPIDKNSNSHRLTLLAHYFDPFPDYSIGSLLRKIRLR